MKMNNFIKISQAVVVIISGIVGYTVYHNSIMPYETVLAQKGIHEDLTFCEQLVKREINLLQRYCNVWSQRLELHSAVADHNSSRTAKLIDDIRADIPIDFFAILNESSDIEYCERVDKAGNDFIVSGLLPISGMQALSGFLKGNRDVYMVAVSPIISAMTYNSAKSLIFARRVDRELEGYLQAFSESDITCVPAIVGEAEGMVNDVHDHLPAGTQVSSYNRRQRIASGAVYLNDVYGNKALTISAVKRDFLFQKVRIAGLRMAAVIVLALLLGFMLINTAVSHQWLRRFRVRTKIRSAKSDIPQVKKYSIDLDKIAASKSTASENLHQKEQFVRLQNNILFDLVRMTSFSGESFGSLINKITESTAEFLEVDRVCIWVFNETFSTINLFDLYNHRLNLHSNGDIVEAEKIPAFFEALQQGDHISVKDVSKDPRLKDFFEHYLSREGISSVLDVPISFGDKIRGVLCHEHVGPPRDWTKYEERYASSIADLISLIFDKFEHKKMEDEYNKTKQIESIGLIAGGIGHDFNNLLTAILGNCSLAMMSCQSDSEQVEFLDNIEKATNRARDLSQQLLNFSREGTPIKKSASILEVIRESANFSLKGSNVKCVVNAPEDLWNVEIDKGQISQVINNLIINADHAMPEGGTITVICENVLLKTAQIENLPGGKYVKITVRDHGVGINPENHKKIFDPYFTTKEKGSGLGLSMCYSIVQKHKGYINVKSEPGVGSEFFIYLPTSEQQDSPVEIKNKTCIKTGSGTILVMDDDEMVRSVLGQTISSFGYSVLYAKDGRETLEMIKESIKNNKYVDAVIMDLTIPGGMGGKETIALLKELDPSIKAFVSSGYSNDPIMTEFEKYGFSGVISKPIDIQSLNMMLHSSLSKQV
ncbi:MAG: ATP-binding protein [Candidatus Auribacterota bacterium]|jgi:nitrogen-specific signal transduction histidine kinase/CheY-like chemotaxis protein|nr:ATP-binding protein [Candidatus Auribacterota bacterium]